VDWERTPQCDQRSTANRRKSSGGNWNALSLNVFSCRNFSASRCFAGVTHDQRIAAIRVAPVIAVRMFAADKLGNQVRPVAVLRQQDAERRPGALIALALVHHFGRKVFHQLFGQEHALLRNFIHVGPRSKRLMFGVGREECVLVRAVVVARLGDLVGDLLQFIRFVAADRLVSVLNGPIVIWPKRGREIIALFYALRSQVHRHVVHHPSRPDPSRG